MYLLRQFLTFSSFTVVSRLLGLIREMLMSYTLGATFAADLFILGFRLPNFFRRFFSEGALHSSLVPELSQRFSHNKTEEALYIAQNIFTVMAIFLLGFVIVIQCCAPLLLKVLAPGFCYDASQYQMATVLTRIMFPYILLVSLSAIFTAILNSVRKFAAEASVPIILNVIMISSLSISLYAQLGLKTVYVLSWAVIVSGIVQLTWLYHVCARQGFKIRFIKPNFNTDLISIFKRMGESAIGASVMQINLFIDLCLASWLPTGSLAYLFYADRLNQLPLSVIGTSLGAVLLPNFSRVTHNKHQMGVVLQDGLVSALQISLPACIGFVLLGDVIIYTLFCRGSFGLYDCLATSKALVLYAFGLPAYVMTKVLASFFFAQKNTRIPLIAAVVNVGINVAGNLLLMPHFAHAGMALATTLSAWVGAIILLTCAKQSCPTFTYGSFYFDIAYTMLWVAVNALLIMWLKHTLHIGMQASLAVNILGLATICVVIPISYLGIGYVIGINRLFAPKTDFL